MSKIPKSPNYFAPGWRWCKVNKKLTVRRTAYGRLKWLLGLKRDERVKIMKACSMLGDYEPHQDNQA